MNINYNSYILRRITGSQSESLRVEKEISLKDLIETFTIKYGVKFKNSLLDNGNQKLKMLVLVNGENITDITQKITDKDKVNILPFITGG